MTQLYPRSQIDIYVKVRVGLTLHLVRGIIAEIDFFVIVHKHHLSTDSAVRRRELQRVRECCHIGSD